MTRDDLQTVCAALDEVRWHLVLGLNIEREHVDLALTRAIALCRRELKLTEQDRADTIRETALREKEGRGNG